MMQTEAHRPIFSVQTPLARSNRVVLKGPASLMLVCSWDLSVSADCCRRFIFLSGVGRDYLHPDVTLSIAYLYYNRPAENFEGRKAKERAYKHSCIHARWWPLGTAAVIEKSTRRNDSRPFSGRALRRRSNSLSAESWLM